MKYLLLLFISSAILFGCTKKEKTNPDDLITWRKFSKTYAGDSTFTFYIPSAFTPDHDGINEYWEPKSNFLDSSNYHIDIFDKTGKIVFKSDAPAKFYGKGSNGYVLPTQTLGYHIEAADKKGGNYTFDGQFAIFL